MNETQELSLPRPVPRLFDDRKFINVVLGTMILLFLHRPSNFDPSLWWCGCSTTEAQSIETYRATLLFCILLREDRTFAIKFFNSYARINPGDAAAALGALARGDEEAKRGMVVLLKSLFEVDQRAAITHTSLFIRLQPSESSTAVQPHSSTCPSKPTAVGQVIDLGGCSVFFFFFFFFFWWHQWVDMLLGYWF